MRLPPALYAIRFAAALLLIFSVYTPVFRNKVLELFEVFDFADPNVCLGRRNVSTVAPQALYLMNSPFVLGQAKATLRINSVPPGAIARVDGLEAGRTPVVVKAGQGYVDDGHGHIGLNRTGEPARDVSVILAPVGMPFRAELTAPGPHCSF